MNHQLKLFLLLIYLLTLLGLHSALATTVFAPDTDVTFMVEITAHVAGCGDEIIQVGEQCDGSTLGGASCSSLGFSGGTLSCSGACTFDTSACTAGGGGGGGGSRRRGTDVTIPDTNVVFTGRAYPLSKVTILKDGQIIVTTIAGPDSNFTATISNLSRGDYSFAVYGEDKNGVRSRPFTFSIFITPGVITKIGGIFIAPTIAVDKSEVRRGDTISIFGQSAPNAEVTVSVHSDQEFFVPTPTDTDGVYLLNFDSTVLNMGNHLTRSKTTLSADISPFSDTIGFLVGSKNVLLDLQERLFLRGDIDMSGQVNLVDFSIAAFWYGKPSPPSNIDLNGDGKVGLIDFSIMAFYWTG